MLITLTLKIDLNCIFGTFFVIRMYLLY